MMKLGEFVCPIDGTNDLDFIAVYDEDGPMGFVCPVCNPFHYPLPVVSEALAEVEVLLASKGELI